MYLMFESKSLQTDIKRFVVFDRRTFNLSPFTVVHLLLLVVFNVMLLLKQKFLSITLNDLQYYK